MNKRILAFVMAALVFSACTIVDEETQISSIHPPTLLIDGLKHLPLDTPLNGEAYYIDDYEEPSIKFSFIANEPVYTAIFLFSAQPTNKDNKLIDGKSLCIAGLTNMIKDQTWNTLSATLSSDENESHFYECQTADGIDPFITSNKVVLNKATFPRGSSFYWGALGYDENYSLTHSSPVRKVNIK
jgi:hypothetical protein